MHTSIDFPNLGIHLENVGKTVTVFGFDIAYYGITIGIGMLAGIAMALMEAKRTGQKQEDYLDLAMFGIIFGIIGARIYYVVFAWDMYKDNLLEIFNTRHGGLAIYGGVIAAVITVFVVARVKKQPVALLLDTAVFGLVTGQMIGRWGNFFNREAFGEYTDSVLAMRLPLDAVRTSDLTEKIRDHIEVIDGVSYIQVHPTFLYESVWNLSVLLFMLWYRKRKRFDGEMLWIYFLGYGVGRFWIEGLRTDQLKVPGTALAVSQLLSAALAGAAVGALTYHYKKLSKKEI